MKKKITLAILLTIPFISIFLIVLFRVVSEPTSEKIIEKLRDKPYYSVNAEFIIKNSKAEQIEKTTLYFSKDDGGRIDFGKDRVKFYNDRGITVKDNISNKEYTVDEDMDKVHSIAFVNNLLSLPIQADSIRENQEEWGQIQYIEFISEISMKNNHLDKVKTYIDKKKKVPMAAVIYDNKSNEVIRILYSDFKELKEVDGIFY